jgi:hypothetical protein
MRCAGNGLVDQLHRRTTKELDDSTRLLRHQSDAEPFDLAGSGAYYELFVNVIWGVLVLCSFVTQPLF